MKTQTCIFAMLLTAGLSSSRAQDTWTQKADFGGTPRYGAVGFSIGSKGYIGTGFDGSNRKDFWEYDPATNTWTQKADFGGDGRQHAAGFSVENKGYVGTGGGGDFRKDFWEYDPTTNIWTRKANFGGVARFTAVGFSIGTKGYIGTGTSQSCCPLHALKDIWEYDPATDTWTQKADFGGGVRTYATGFSIGSKGYIGTGQDNNVVHKDFWEFDPITNTWSQKADFGGTARNAAMGFSIDSNGYIGTGGDVTGPKKDFWEYNPTANTWTQKADFRGSARDWARGFAIASKGYVGTGADDFGFFKDLWEYTPAAAQTSWIELAPIGGPPSPRELHVAVYDPATNRMIIHGGGNGSALLSDAWVLTNADGTETTSPTWTKLLPTNPLVRVRHAAVYDSLSNRMVVFGGQGVTGYLNDVWVLTNANGTGGDPEWLQLEPSGGPPVVRAYPTAVYDAVNNRMTIFGGQSAQGGDLGDVWVLTNANGTEPTTPSWTQLFPGGIPIPPRNSHTAVYDANSNRMIVFGGDSDFGNNLFNDVWVLTNANGLGGNSEWVELAPDGTPPSPRYSQAAVYDPTTNRMIVFGGTDNSVTFNETWVLTNANDTGSDTPVWVLLAPSGTLPTARNQFAATYSVSTNRLSIFAGDNSPGCCNLLNDVWVLPGANGIAAAVSLSQTDLSFGTQLVGTTSEPQIITLTNTGDATLTVSSIAASGDFAQRNDCGSSVPAGASCTIRVAFRPSEKGVRTGRVTITDNAGDSPQIIRLKGTGTVVQLSPSRLDFGDQTVGTISDPKTATITNTGSADLHIHGIGISGANFGDFAETTTCGSKLAAGGSCTIDVTFTPGARGDRHASLKIVDDGGASPQAVPLAGTGVPR